MLCSLRKEIMDADLKKMEASVSDLFRYVELFKIYIKRIFG